MPALRRARTAAASTRRTGKASAEPSPQAAVALRAETTAETTAQPPHVPDNVKPTAHVVAGGISAGRKGLRKRALVESTAPSDDTAGGVSLGARGKTAAKAGGRQGVKAKAGQKPQSQAETDAAPVTATARGTRKRARTEGAPATAARSSGAAESAHAAPEQNKKRARGKTGQAKADDESVKPQEATEMPIQKAPRKQAKQPQSRVEEPHSPAFSERAAHAATTVLSFRAPAKDSVPTGVDTGKLTASKRRSRGAANLSSAPSKAVERIPAARRSAGTAKRNVSQRQPDALADEPAAEPLPRAGRSKTATVKRTVDAAKPAAKADPSQASVATAASQGAAGEADDAKLKMLAHSAPKPGAKRRRQSSEQAEDGTPAAIHAGETGAAVASKTAPTKKRRPAAQGAQSGPAPVPSLKRRRVETGSASSHPVQAYESRCLVLSCTQTLQPCRFAGGSVMSHCVWSAQVAATSRPAQLSSQAVAVSAAAPALPSR